MVGDMLQSDGNGGADGFIIVAGEQAGWIVPTGFELHMVIDGLRGLRSARIPKPGTGSIQRYWGVDGLCQPVSQSADSHSVENDGCHGDFAGSMLENPLVGESKGDIESVGVVVVNLENSDLHAAAGLAEIMSHGADSLQGIDYR